MDVEPLFTSREIFFSFLLVMVLLRRRIGPTIRGTDTFHEVIHWFHWLSVVGSEWATANRLIVLKRIAVTPSSLLWITSFKIRRFSSRIFIDCPMVLVSALSAPNFSLITSIGFCNREPMLSKYINKWDFV